MGVDPYLPQDQAFYEGQVRAISAFCGLVKCGYFGYGREVGSATVSSALTAVGQAISMERRYNPLKLDGSDRLLQPLQIMMAGLRKWDKPTKKKLPVEVDVVELLCNLGPA